jgi:hypothetical protein
MGGVQCLRERLILVGPLASSRVHPHWMTSILKNICVDIVLCRPFLTRCSMIAKGFWGRLRCAVFGKQPPDPHRPDSAENWEEIRRGMQRQNEESLAFAHRLTHWYGHRCVQIRETFPCRVHYCGQWFCKERATPWWWPRRR